MVATKTPRKTLASELDRLDSFLDGFSVALNESVAAAVQEALDRAVSEKLPGIIAQVLSSPEVVQRLQPQTAPASQPIHRARPHATHSWQDRVAPLAQQVVDLYSAVSAWARSTLRGCAARWPWKGTAAPAIVAPSHKPAA
jgi:hypothetical protein